MIAYLGMYDRPETAKAWDIFWVEIRGELGFGPTALTRTMDVWDIWRRTDLVLAQTCGMPYRRMLHDKVQLVGTIDHGLSGCPSAFYQSVIVAHRDRAGEPLGDFAGKRFAYNEAFSQSGWSAPITHMQSLGCAPSSLLQTGAHRLSAKAVAAQKADFAGLDAQTWRLIQRYDDFADTLVEIARTAPTPGLPLITSLSQDADALFAAVESAMDRLPRVIRTTLDLCGLTRLPKADYLAIANAPSPDKLAL